MLTAFCAVWGASVIADSGVFSTALSEAADPRYVGTALSAQTALGFALTVVSIQLVPLLAEVVGWRYAFLLLAPGPALGAIAMRALGSRGEPRPPGGRPRPVSYPGRLAYPARCNQVVRLPPVGPPLARGASSPCPPRRGIRPLGYPGPGNPLFRAATGLG